MNAARLFLPLLAALTCAPAVAQDATSGRAAQLEAADEARQAGEFDEARRILLALLSAAPDDPDLLRRIAMVEAGDGNFDAAQARIDRATAIAPDDLDVALARGYILFWRGEYDASERTVAEIAARDPDYPELAPLQANLDRRREAGGFRLRAISVSAGLSDIAFDNRPSQTWSSQAASVSLDVSRADTFTFGIAREDRGATDTRISGRLDHRIGTGFVYIAATIVPTADFQEDFSLATGGEFALADGVAGLLDLRYAEYATGSIVAVQPAIRFDLGRDVAVTGRAINLFGGGEDYRLGGSVRVDYRPEGGLALFAIAASYPDVEADGVRELRSGAIGATLPLGERVSLTAAGSYDDRENSYRRLAGTLALTYRFGAP